MRTLLVSVIYFSSCFFTGQARADGIHQETHWEDTTSLKYHLETINSYWTHYAASFDGLDTPVAFGSDIERISEHLQLVATYLESLPQETGVSNDSYSRRLALLDTLKRYGEHRVFPVNSHHAIRTPCFVDDFGTACAVGYLMLASGHKTLVDRIKEDFNHNWLKDIPIPEVDQWASDHGFSVDELKWIQPTYATLLNARPVGSGTDSAVKCFTTNSGDVAFAGGSFTSANDSDCKGMVQLVDSSMSCIATGFTGNVNKQVYFGNTLYAAGEFQINGKHYGMVKRTDSSLEPVELAQNYEYNGTALYWFNSDGMLAECNVNDPDDCHLWKSSDGSWEKIASIHGYINDIVSYQGKTVAGSFDSITAHYSHGDSTFEANNIARFNPNSNTWSLYPDEVDNEVLTLEPVGLYLYVGGKCLDTDDGSHSFCLMSYLNGSFQQIVKASDFHPINENTAIYDIAIDPYSGLPDDILFAGNFDYSPSMGTKFSGLATYDPLLGQVKGFGQFDGPVYSVQYTRQGLYIGGEFGSTFGTEGLNNICFVPNKTNITDTTDSANAVQQVIDNEESISVFPNPTDGHHVLELQLNMKALVDFSLYTASGQLIRTNTLGNTPPGTHRFKFDISQLQQGVYIYSIQIGDKRHRKTVFRL